MLHFVVDDDQNPVSSEELAVVGKVQSIDYGQGRMLQKAMIVWLTGPRVGRKQLFDERDLVKVEK